MSSALSRDSRPPYRRPLPRTLRWLLPPAVVVGIGFLGILLYLGGLGAPTDHLREFPVAVVNEDEGAEMPSPGGSPTEVQMGQEVADGIVEEGEDNDEVDFRAMSRDEADDALSSGDAYGAIVIPSDFSERSVALVSSSLGGDGEGTQPVIDIVTSPQAGSMTSRLATGVMDPAVEGASSGVGEQLLPAAQEQIRQLEEADRPAPTLTPVAESVLQDPVVEEQREWEELPSGTALGMAPFYWAIVALVVGLSGSVAVSTLVDGLLGVTPWEMGPKLDRYRPAGLSRPATFALKAGLVVLGGAGAAGVMMLAGAIVDLPMPHGGLLYLTTWLGIAAIGVTTLSMITMLGSAGMLFAMFYLVFMGLPSAGAVSPQEALPPFFAGLAKWEPLHYLWLCTRDILFFDAQMDAGMGQGIAGLAVILVVFTVLALVVGALWDRLTGRRGIVRGSGKHAAA
ncbi:ABC transporter permease [Kocuria palustris]|uniref:YhgE/Pip domain-containing protein n=1 Tax=Kocuria palustris TaxID=71999 RepID=UPI0011A88543|nr:ABC transporter permease [Kocuria palustris]